MKIGVGITTHNRPEVFEKTYRLWQEHLPPRAELVVVDDASIVPVDASTYRFEKNAGVARAKNKCLELLDNVGCDEFFLVDDDCYPLVDDWWRAYVESPEPHLMRIFKDLSGDVKLNDIHVTYSDEWHVAYSGARGCMIYVHRDALRIVGGMNPEFGRWGWEHGDWSNRIHNAGLTTWHYADVTGSAGLIYCMDEHVEVDRSIPLEEREAVVSRNAELFDSYRESWVFVPFRNWPNVVVTTLFTRQEDPQRGITWKPDTSHFLDLARSLDRHDTTLYVLHDQPLKGNVPSNVTAVQVPTGTNPYFQRWLSIYAFLRDLTEVDRVWCVDATDVTMLRPPWSQMRADTLYLGHEPSPVSTPWLRDNHPASIIVRTIRDNKRCALLNAGLVGGSRRMVLEFTHAMCKLVDDEARRSRYEKDNHDLGIGDMGALQVIGYSPAWENRIETGTHVNTIFKAYKDNGVAWWQHK